LVEVAKRQQRVSAAHPGDGVIAQELEDCVAALGVFEIKQTLLLSSSHEILSQKSENTVYVEVLFQLCR